MTEQLTIKPQPPVWPPKSGNFGPVLMLWLVNLLGAWLLRLRSVVRFTEVWWVFVQKTKCLIWCGCGVWVLWAWGKTMAIVGIPRRSTYLE